VALAQGPSFAWQGFLRQLTNLLALSPDHVQWGFTVISGHESLPLIIAAVVVLALFLWLLVMMMVPLGQCVGACLDEAANPVTAYSVNLLGSLAGIWGFALLSFFWLPPAFWFVTAFVALLLLTPKSRPALALASVVLLAGAAALLTLTADDGAGMRTYWSPYQKLIVQPVGESEYQVHVNNVGYMSMASTTPEFLKRHPEVAEVYRDRSSYDLPFHFAKSNAAVLIVGAGAGNDASAALRHGAQQVDAVEIDPAILSIGERLHPDHPYSSPRVRKVLNDARAFMREARGSYDVIIFGLLDSHTQFSDLGNMRIDNYVYTEEAFAEAKRLLKPDGLLVVKFEVRPPWEWIGQRFYRILEGRFGHPPLVSFVPQVRNMASATVFLTSHDSTLWQRAQRPDLQARLAPPLFPLPTRASIPLTTDDWPYIYQRDRAIPRPFLTVSLILMGIAVLMARPVLRLDQPGSWQFFFLGAGFLLLETQMISRLALYFGTTWLVNCVAISGILVVLVLANLYVARRDVASLVPWYIVLVAALLVTYLLPWQRLPYPTRSVGVLLGLAYCVPVFCAGVIFTDCFRRCSARSAAFGANIVGAVAGGLAQNVSFIVGLKALLLLAAVFYAAAALLGRTSGRAQDAGLASAAKPAG
jgi:spermidine synthase